MLTLTGTVDRVVFRSGDSDFAVARLRIEGVGDQRTYDDLTTIVGNLARVSEGENLKVGGEWERHPRHGRHFRVSWIEQRLPASAEGIEKFLGSGSIKGVGAGTARRIVEWFGERTLQVIDEDPKKLFDIPSLSRKRAELVIEGWRAQSHARELMLFLQSHRLPLFLSKRLLERYGDECVAVLQSDPYKLVQEVSGVGFKTADNIAVELGLSRTSTSRFVAGIKHVLEDATREGHVFLPKDVLLARASALLCSQPTQIEPALLEASRQALIVLDGTKIYLSALFYAERGVAGNVTRLMFGPSIISERVHDDADETVNAALGSLGIQFTGQQVEAVKMVLREKVSIITGGPGTGKTMCLHALIAALDGTAFPYSLCAPTGRAAKRMTTATGKPASTIHRLLGYQPGSNGFTFHADHQLEPQLVIVDEVSMLDVTLFHHLVRAIPDSGNLLVVGDVDQLPAVGPGNVLRDLLESETIPHVCLEELFRQAEGSRIITFAHQIRRGEVQDSRPAEQDGDLFLIPVKDAVSAARVIGELVVRRIPARFGLDPKAGIQVLSPSHRGPAGVGALNSLLQDELNPRSTPDGGVELSGRRFRVGDKVMQMRNNYEKNVYNGDLGLITAIDIPQNAITLRFGEEDDGREIDCELNELSDVSLAYAASIHKSQGSEFPCVVMPILLDHYPLLQRNLLYTGVTRARRLCILVYQPKALAIAINTNNQGHRYTGLSDRLLSQDPLSRQEFSPLPFD